MAQFNEKYIAQVKSALLNTCVMREKENFEPGSLNLSNCMDSKEFREAAYDRLQREPFIGCKFNAAIEPARKGLMEDIEKKQHEAYCETLEAT